jgi:hypothetical protein
VTEAEFQRELLLTRIEAHRSLLWLELRSARDSFDPMATALEWAGVDQTLVDAVLPAARAVYHQGLPQDLKNAGPLVALIAALLVVWSD